MLAWILCLAALFGSVWMMSLGLKHLAASDAWEDIGGIFVYDDDRAAVEAVALLCVIVLAFLAPRFGRRCFIQCERMFERFAMHRTQALLAATVLPVVIRLALLPALPVPQPYTPDEFGYLLLADTFASGRITNPTHPMWPYFESLYIFHQPTYTSLYPIASALFMSLPMALHLHPFFGVCASVGLMCGALAWMLQAWLPPKWALFGALVAGARFSIGTYWMNSYWGGAAGVIGGALLAGALLRLIRKPRVRDAWLLGLGVAILSQSRPFEGALLSLPVAALLIHRFASRAHRNLRVLAAFSITAVLIAAGTLYYNWRVTGDPWLWPYQLHQRIYGTPQNLLGTAPVLTAERVAAQKDIRDNFHWQLDLFQAQSSWQGLLAALPKKMLHFWNFYFQPLFTFPLLFLAAAFAHRHLRLLLITGLFVLFGGFALYPFFFPHYAAPLCGLFLVLTMEGVRHMRAVRWRGRRIGAPLFRWWFLACAACTVLLVSGTALAPDIVDEVDWPRSQVQHELERQGGRHLVLVEYTSAHDYHHPWVYNAAEIDKSSIVWAQATEASNLAPLLRYYSDRKVWVVKAGADEDTPKLEPLGTPRER